MSSLSKTCSPIMKGTDGLAGANVARPFASRWMVEVVGAGEPDSPVSCLEAEVMAS